MKKRFKVLASLTLVATMLFSGLSFDISSTNAAYVTNPELSKLKQNFEANGFMYLTEKAVHSDFNFEYNGKNIETKVASFKSSEVDKLDKTVLKNIVVDAAELDQPDVLEKVKELYNSGSRIVIRKDNITLDEAYKYVGQDIDPDQPKFAEMQDSQLTTVGISLFKHSSGFVYAGRLNVEVNTEYEVKRLIAIALSDDRDIIRQLESGNQPPKTSYIQTIKPVIASLSTSWPPVQGLSDYTSWSSVNVNIGYASYKHPDNPHNGQYWTMFETGLTVTPRFNGKQYYSGKVYVYHKNSSGGKVQYYAPTAANTSSINVSFAWPPQANLNYTLGTSMNIAMTSGGPGTNNIQWTFYPRDAFGNIYPTKKQTYYECASQYYQSGSYISQGASYTIEMHYDSGLVPPVFVHYGNASKSGLYTSGY